MRIESQREPGNTDWAKAIVRDYEDGKRVPKVSLDAAVKALGIAPGTLLRKVKLRGVDRMALASQSADDDEQEV